jgi:hypothetical protein
MVLLLMLSRYCVCLFACVVVRCAGGLDEVVVAPIPILLLCIIAVFPTAKA